MVSTPATTAVLLRPTEPGDLDEFFHHQQDPEARRQAAFVTDAPADRERFNAHWQRLLADPTVRSCTVLAGAAAVGHVGSFVEGGRREVTYWLGRACWGRGIATRALAQLVATEAPGVLHARVAQDHYASIKVLQRNGFAVHGVDSGFGAGRGEQTDEFLLQRPAGGAQPVLRTARLRLDALVLDDAAFILELLNEPGWLQHIGDRGVRTLVDAQRYIASGPTTMLARHGHGLWRVARLGGADSGGVPVGICGLIKRDTLAGVDLGYALLARHEGQGYAREAAAATLAWGRQHLGPQRVLAIVSPGNARSVGLLTALGFKRDPVTVLTGDLAGAELYAAPLASIDAQAARRDGDVA